MNNYDQFFSIFIATFVMSLIMSLAYIAFVLPNDIVRMEIIECMSSHESEFDGLNSQRVQSYRSREAYDSCITKLGHDDP